MILGVNYGFSLHHAQTESPLPPMYLHIHANWDMIESYLIILVFIHKFRNVLSKMLLEKIHWIMLGI